MQIITPDSPDVGLSASADPRSSTDDDAQPGTDSASPDSASPDPAGTAAASQEPGASSGTAEPSPDQTDDPGVAATAAPEPGPSGAELEEPVPAASQIVYVSEQGAGQADGRSQGQSAPISQLDDLLARGGAGMEVRIVAPDGVITVDQTIRLANGGAAGAPARIRSWPPGSQSVTLVGNRVDPYTADGEPGLEVFRLAAGADHLAFSGLDFQNVGVAFRVAADISDLAISDIEATNVRRFLDTNAAQDDGTASVVGLEVADVTVAGFSKNVLRLQYATTDVVIEDVAGDSQRQDGDNFAVGIQLADRVSDVILRRVRMSNANDSTGEYWNGDGFSVERGVTRVQFIDTVAEGNTDGGYDIKGTAIVMRSVRAIGNKRNYRLWGQIEIQDCLGLDPLKRGGSGTQAQVQIAQGAEVTMRNCTFTDDDAATIVFDVDGPGATLLVEDTDVSRAEAAQLSTVEPGNEFVPDDVSEQVLSGG